MTTASPSHPTPAELREARLLLGRLTGATHRDRIAFTLGYVLAVDAVAPDLPEPKRRQHVAKAKALHALCAESFR